MIAVVKTDIKQHEIKKKKKKQKKKKKKKKVAVSYNLSQEYLLLKLEIQCKADS